MNCKICGLNEAIPFECKYCKDVFCYSHRMPNNHNCAYADLYVKNNKKSNLRRTNFSLTEIKNLIYYSRLKSSHIEIIHLSVATLLVLLVGLSLNNYQHISWHFLVIFISAFLVHELAHKFLAQYYKGWAEFRLNFYGLIVTAFSAIPMNPFKFIAPGAVHLRVSNESQFGRVALIGPLTNLVMGFSFFLIYEYIYQSYYFSVGASFNGWIALFNLLPFGGLDGQKIFDWNKKVWILMMAGSVGLFMIPSIF